MELPLTNRRARRGVYRRAGGQTPGWNGESSTFPPPTSMVTVIYGVLGPSEGGRVTGAVGDG